MVLASTACGSDNWQRVGPWLYAIECRRMADCYMTANSVCPYGYGPVSSETVNDGATAQTWGNATFVQTRRHGEMIIRCVPPKFCSDQRDCVRLGLRCVISQRYPGKNVCAMQ